MAVFSPGGLTRTVYSNNAAGTNGTFTTTQLTPTWTSNTTGNFSDSSKWLLNFSPNMTGIGALFGAAITADTIVNVDNSPTLGSITFDNSHKYTLTSSGGNLTLDTLDPAGAQVNVLSGSHELALPVSVNAAVTTVNVGPANSTPFLLKHTELQQRLSDAGENRLGCHAGSFVERAFGELHRRYGQGHVRSRFSEHQRNSELHGDHGRVV